MRAPAMAASSAVSMAAAALALLALPELSMGKMKVKVMGNSGKFEFYDDGANASHNSTTETSDGAETSDTDSTDEAQSSRRIRVTMDALKEVDADGNEVGKGGQDAHSVNSFASTDFEIGEEEHNFPIGTAKASRVDFTATVSAGRQVSVETYLITQDGTVGMGEDQWSVSAGALKWNIVFPEWEFCGCSKGQKQEEGEFLDLTITIEGLGEAKRNASSLDVDLGDGASLALSKYMEVDGEVKNMTEGYPKIELAGSKTSIIFRFPKFENRAVYDPVMQMTVTTHSIESEVVSLTPNSDVKVGSNASRGDVEIGNESSADSEEGNYSASIDGSPRNAVSLIPLLPVGLGLLLS